MSSKTPPSSPPPGGSSHPDHHSRHERLRHEAQVVQSFVSVLQRKLNELRLRSPNTTTFELEPAERQALLKMNNRGLWQSAAAGIVTLVALRRARSRMMQYLWQRRPTGPNGIPPTSTSPFAPPTYANPNVLQSPSSPFAQLPKPPPARGGSMFQTILGWMLDLAVSSTVAVTTSLYFTDMPSIVRELGRFPLLPGRSKVAEEFCPVVVGELERLWQLETSSSSVAGTEMTTKTTTTATTQTPPPRPFWMQHPENPYLQSLFHFAENCQRRQAYQRRLRQENGMIISIGDNVGSSDDGDDDDGRPIPIPEPGVPMDVDDTDDASVGDRIQWTGQYSWHTKDTATSLTTLWDEADDTQQQEQEQQQQQDFVDSDENGNDNGRGSGSSWFNPTRKR